MKIYVLLSLAVVFITLATFLWDFTIGFVRGLYGYLPARITISGILFESTTISFCYAGLCVVKEIFAVLAIVCWFADV